MKMIKIITALILVFALIVSCFAAPAEAAAMTAAMLGAGLIAVAAGAGAIYSSASQSQQNLVDWASARVDSWLAGRSIAEAFGSEYIRMAHGKLVIPAVIYNAIQDMIDEDVEETGVTPGGSDVPVVSGTFYDKLVSAGNGNTPLDPPLYSYDFVNSASSRGFSASHNYSTGYITCWVDGEQIAYFKPSWGQQSYIQTVVNYAFAYASKTQVNMMVQITYQGAQKYFPVYGFAIPSYVTDTNLRLDRTWEKDVCDVGYQWEGNISGSEADTNIDDLIDTIYKEAAADTLGVTGEIEAETPYPPQPTEYPIDDVLGGMDTINQSINDAGKDVTDAIGSVVDGIHSQTGAINDAADAVSDKVQSLEDTLVDALDVPTTAEASGFKWDLSQLFPFCIPFDIAHMYQAFDGAASAPNIQIPIVIPSFGFSYTMQLDFSPFNGVAAILRQVELIAFGLALAWGTSKVIRW